MQLILAVARTFFIQFYRNKISVVLLILFPLFFLFIFNIAFGSTDIGGSVTYDIVIINQDAGIEPSLVPTLPPNIQSWGEVGVGSNLTGLISDLKYNDSGQTPLFRVIDMDVEDVTSAIQNGEISIAMIIPANYSMMVMNQINNIFGNQSLPGYPTSVNAVFEFIMDENNVEAQIPLTILQQVVNSFHEAINSQRFPQVIEIQSHSVIQGEVNSIFDFIASGLLIFAIILSTSYFAALLLSDQEHLTIRRIQLSVVTPAEYIGGFVLLSFILVLLQCVVLLLSAVYIFGFDPAGSLLRGYIILILSTLPMYALVFTAGGIFKSSDTAGSALGFSSSIIGFASNAFFNMPYVPLIPNVLSFTSGSPDLLLWDLVPWTHAVNAMRTVMLFDQTLTDVLGDLMMLIISSLIWLVVAIVFYMKRTFKMEE